MIFVSVNRMFLKNLSVTNQKKNKMNILLLINIVLFGKKQNNELFIFNKTKKKEMKHYYFLMVFEMKFFEVFVNLIIIIIIQ